MICIQVRSGELGELLQVQSLSAVLQICGRLEVEMAYLPFYYFRFQNVLPQFLQTHHFPGTHDHIAISQALISAANDWCIDFDKQLVAFTTESGSNVVKALENMNVLRLACAGHTLNLAVQKALQVPQVFTPLARCRKLVTHFHKSRVNADEFKRNQSLFSDVPKHKLIHDVITRWNSTYDMIERVCEQQLPISSVLLQC